MQFAANGEAVERFRVADMPSPVIGYQRGREISPGKLTPSNLYAYWEFPATTHSSMVAKPEEFVSWAKKVFQWVYKATPCWHEYKSYRVSKRVKESILDEGLEIVPY